MPNWCENFVEVTGKTEDISKLNEAIENAEEGAFRAMLHIDMSDEEKVANKLLGEDGEEDWYRFNVENYGTKWDIYEYSHDYLEDIVDEGVSQLNMNFSTAWSPPVAIFETLAEKLNVRVKLYYVEEGMDFAGIMDTEGTDAYHTDDMSEADDIPEDLDNCFDIQYRIEEYMEDCA